DSGLLTTVAAPAGDTCGRRACWAERSGGFRYRDPERTPEGADELSLQKGRRDGRTKIVFEARGEDLDLPELGFLESPLTVQLRRSGSPLCWGARYTFPPERANGEARFKDRSDAPPPPIVSSTTTTTTPAPSATTSTTTTTTAASSTTSVTTGPGGTTTTTPGGASVEVVVVDDAAQPVADADVTITYTGGEEDSEFTDQTGVAFFTAQPIGIGATIVAEDDEDRTGATSSAGFVAGVNRLTVTVR
ncbi:MAG: hypothetical protein L0221_02260, partial [Chloroflexi bacterium]|nr:hypothetical protein [Chloroflexota bacterium]